MKNWRAGLFCLAACAAASPAAAVVVTSIKITSALPDYIQVSEVIATQSGTGNDVALASAGAIATASSIYAANTLPSNAIDGIGPSAYPNLYHSANGNGSDFLLITLAQAFDLSGITIQGRTDLYSSRDYYAYQLFNGTSLVGSGNIDARIGGNSGSVRLAATPPTTSAVPEPATWAMMVAGFGLMGGALRRRKTAVSFA